MRRRMAEKQEKAEKRKGLFVGFLAGVTAAALASGLPGPNPAALALRDGGYAEALDPERGLLMRRKDRFLWKCHGN